MNKIEDNEFIRISEFFPCSCIGSCSGINVTIWTDYYEDKKDESGVYHEVLLSMYTKGHKNKSTLRDKLRFIWRIITHGHPYDDVVVLTNEDRKKLIDFLRTPDSY